MAEKTGDEASNWMMPIGFEALIEMQRPAYTAMADVNTRLYESIAAVSKEWASFVNRRLKEDWRGGQDRNKHDESDKNERGRVRLKFHAAYLRRPRACVKTDPIFLAAAVRTHRSFRVPRLAADSAEPGVRTTPASDRLDRIGSPHWTIFDPGSSVPRDQW